MRFQADRHRQSHKQKSGFSIFCNNKLLSGYRDRFFMTSTSRRTYNNRQSKERVMKTNLQNRNQSSQPRNYPSGNKIITEQK